jgi:hypothetical protein
MKSLEEVGKWLDDDKDYQISTQEKYDEFVKKRNYKFSSDGDVLVSTGQGLENWRIGKAEAVRIEETRS